VKSQKKIEGRWWLPHSAIPEFGILKLRSNGTVVLTTRQPISQSNAEILMGSVADQNPYPDGQVIHGRDIHDSPVSLFNSCKAGHSHSGGMVKRRIVASPAVRGLHLSSAGEKRFAALAFKISQLHEWLGVQVVTGFQLNEAEYGWKVPIQQPQFLHEVEKGVRFRIDVQLTPNFQRSEFQIRPSHRIWFHFSSPTSVEEVLERWIPWARNLFSLLVGRRALCDDVELFEHDPWISGTPAKGCKILELHRDESEEILNPWMVAPYPTISGSLAQILVKWNDTEKKLMPAIDLLCSVAFWGSLPLEAQFLFLVQAAEVFHGRKFDSVQCDRAEHNSRVKEVLAYVPNHSQSWVRQALLASNHKRLDERLKDLFDVCPRHAGLLFPDTTETAARIRRTRNHLTHYTGDPLSKKLIRSEEMYVVIRRLKSLLWLLLLNEIGCPENALDQVVKEIAGVDTL
jgi:hypothetical protein